ncbi:alpha-2-macroglobulin-like protein 1 [Neoarius graeffei]|uniref:alpha-2-macroglobulin-like protein 1 n=1 Tax=Neoarius graeffei TaxID=443677 RepID=UPI00298CFBC6|nr:alpha-2-macroglobulin-like protein 1 [Neoarius graeffei]
MHVSGVISAVLLLIPGIIAQQISDDAIYLVAVTSQAEGGTTETLCVTVKPRRFVQLDVTLEYNEISTTILKERFIIQEYYKCVTFQVPVVSVESVADITIQIKGRTSQKKTTKILIRPPAKLIIIETDKPIYKPGQMVKFRVVSLDSNFFTNNRTFPRIDLRDPNSNRIGQWLDVSTNSGFVDLSYPINSEATNGFYVITVWDNNRDEIAETFEVKDYVLPKFEVTVELPPVITILETSATLKVCAKYTYGKPVIGTVRARVCHNSYSYWGFIRGSPPPPDICKNYTLQTDRTGCAQHVLSLNEFDIRNSRYQRTLTVQTEVEESGTGVIMQGSGNSQITNNMVMISFVDSPTTYKPGMMYEGKIEVTDPNSNPVKKKPVYLTLNYGNNINSVQTLVTNDDGIASFSFDAKPWGQQQVSLKAQYEKTEKPVLFEDNQLNPYYPTAYLTLQPFYSKSQSFIELKSISEPFSCDGIALVTAQFVIKDSFRPWDPFELPVDPIKPSIKPIKLPIEPTEPPIDPIKLPIEPTELPIDPIKLPIKPIKLPIKPIKLPIKPTKPPIDPIKLPIQQRKLPFDPIELPFDPIKPPSPRYVKIAFYYMVMSRGHLVQQGHVLLSISPRGDELRGRVLFSLKNVEKMSPVAQVVLYTLLPNGEAVADSRNYAVQLCLPNKVSLNFKSPSELPGEQTSLTLRAAPGSLCSVRAIDKSLLLLQPEKDVTIESVFAMLPFQMLSGYPYKIDDEDLYPCVRKPPPLELQRISRSIPYFPIYEKVDVYNVFKDVGIKILTNADIRSPSVCPDILPYFRKPGIEQPAAFEKEATLAESSPAEPVVTIRKYFPETWVWDLVSVSLYGVKSLTKTVPDSITTWQADAFCTSPIGFGVALKAELTAFQPFFVSLTMPSSVIRGEVFTLKATVFNYLQSCMMVKVVLADSKQFSVQKVKNSVYTRCLCADESWTVSWIITPLVLGEVTIEVSAEAVKSSVLCGKSAVDVPQKGRIDTVIKTLLVQAEGTKKYKTYNELLCPSGSTVEETVSLTLPKIMVDGSATASVSVVGDLMGRALQNLASLLAMPYGCGEQNMLRFAPNIYILDYLESTNQLTPETRSEAENYLITGYQRELTYKHNDGSYSAFGMSDKSGNTWLTAFVMKSFGRASRYIYIDQVYVEQAKTWLGQQQQDNGCFASVGQLFHTDMKGGVNDEVTLTAYITAAMLELNYTITDPVVKNGIKCLRNEYTKVASTYAKALLFYTFTLAEDQSMRNTLISELDAVAIVSENRRYWSSVNSGFRMASLEVETTSYVLLALMSGPQLSGFSRSYSISIVYWLSQQQNAFGGFSSTQDTVVALQALAKYSQITYSPAGFVSVTIKSPSGLITSFTVTQTNRLLYQQSQLKEVPGDYRIQAEGKGCVYVQFTVSYNIPPPPDRSSFSISASASGNCRVPNPVLTVAITVMYNGKRPSTNMVVIEVKPLSGFSADETSVTLKEGDSNSSDGVVKRVEKTDGTVIIYLDGLTKGKEKVYSLTLVQDDEVQNLKPAVVKIYDYYEPGDMAVTEYPSPCPVQ